MSESSKVLIVEDESILALLLQRSLEKNGYVVTDIVPFAENVMQSVLNARPNAIIMDITLKGGMDGIEAAKLLKEYFEIPVIFLTAHTDPATFERAREAGFHAYINKPLNIQQLLGALDSLFGQTASFSEAQESV